jgi:hypothetical protein
MTYTPQMTPIDYNPFHGALVWHRFDQRMTDDELEAALAAIGVTAVLIDRAQKVVFVDKDNSVTPEIQQILNNWSPQ